MLLARRRHLATPVLLLGLVLGATVAWGQTDGQIGNLNDPVPPSVPGILVGDQVFAYLVVPAEQVSCPEGGFILQTVSMLIELTPEQVPATFVLNAGLLGARFEDATGFYVPAEPVGTSPEVAVTITEPGIHALTVPLQGACGCEPTEQPFFLSFGYVGPAVANLVIDDQGAPGIAYLDSGAGFVDLHFIGRPSGGKVIIWGDIVCCAVVGVETSTWQDVKALFR